MSSLRQTLIILLAATMTLSTDARAETVTVKAALNALPEVLPKGIKQEVRLIDASTLAAVVTAKGKATKKAKLSAEAGPSIMLVSQISKKKKDNRRGFVSLLKPGSVNVATIQTRIRMRATTTAAPANARLAFNALTAIAGPTRVGVSASDFTVSGPGTHGRMATAIADSTIGNIVRNAPCYDQNSGVVIIEVDPHVVEARNTEFNLCSSGVADPSTCVQNNYVAPDHSVRGSLDTNGGQATLTVEFVDPNGNVIASETVTGSLSDFFELIDQVTKRLAERMCEGQVTLTSAICPAIACTCCGQNQTNCQSGVRWLHQYAGIARGAVGATVRFNALEIYTTLNCGNWSTGTCITVPCCTRMAGETEQTSFTASFPFPFPIGGFDCICPAPASEAVSFLVQLVEGNLAKESEKIPFCPE